MKTIFESYGMKSLKEIQELETNAKEYLLELNGENATPAEIQEYILNDINFRYKDEEINLNKNLDNNIVCIANLGLWNGKFKPLKFFQTI